MEKSFHGRTLATIAATGQDKYQKPFSPLTPSFLKVPFNNLDALKNSVSLDDMRYNDRTYTGESGVNLATLEYLKGVRKLCDEKVFF